MNQCLHLRPELEVPMPPRMRGLPLDARGYPVPWFVAWHDGVPEFRAMDGQKWNRAIRESRCWVCGDILGRWKTFVIGPMCGVNRTTAEPACHLECAEWSARNCPFLSRPQAVRREDDEINSEALKEQSAGTAIDRNPGVSLLWTTDKFKLFDAGNGKPLIEIGEPRELSFWAKGRLATREEVEESVNSGLPLLRELALRDPQKGALEALGQYVARFWSIVDALWPVAERVATRG
jgi:hypothetical protein